MSDLRELYQETIIDHGRYPRNFGMLHDATHHHEGFNPLCGDKIIVHLNEKNGTLENIMFEGSGCAISMASASLMTEVLKGKSMAQIEKIFAFFHGLLTTGGCVCDESRLELGKLKVLAGVAAFPVRVKCATLAWHTLKAALSQETDAVSTE